MVYIPQLQSRFYCHDEYEIFEKEIFLMCNNYDYVYLFGDYNAQTAELPVVNKSTHVLPFVW